MTTQERALPATAIFTLNNTERNLPVGAGPARDSDLHKHTQVAHRTCSYKNDVIFYMIGSRKFLIIILILPLVSCGGGSRDAVEISGRTMGTGYSVQIPAGQTTIPAATLAHEIKALLDRINRIMSTYLEDSELTIINNNKTSDPVPVSSELYEVVSTALEISRKTGGAFDITIGAVVNLWGFGPEEKQGSPEPEEISRTLRTTGYEFIDLIPSPPAIKKKFPGIYLDLSGIAKGYAVDSIADYLHQLGIRHYLVEIGGEIRTGGMNGKNELWRVGIERPLTFDREIQRIISLGNKGMATSGNYRNFIVNNDKRYSHTIDPRTGWPVSHNLVSVTVLDRSAMIADALSTALLVMGEKKGYNFAKREKIPAFFIVKKNSGFEEKYTAQFSQYLIE